MSFHWFRARALAIQSKRSHHIHLNSYIAGGNSLNRSKMADEYPKFKAAAIQTSSVFLNREKTTEKACELIGQAASKGAEIIVFPECFIPTHPYWFHFMTSDEGQRRFYLDLFKNSVEIPSPSTEKLCKAALEADSYVIIGVAEKDPFSMGTLYNTQLFIDNNGTLMGKHRKIAPTTWEKLVHTGGDGSTLQVFNTKFGAIGGLICGEHTMSLARFALLAMGEKIHAASWPAFPLETQRFHKEAANLRNRYHAFEGKVFVISASACFDDGMIEVICREDQRKLIANAGGFSSIIGPDGRYIAGPSEKGEDIVYADIDMERIISAKAVQDVLGHYSRPDIFTLLVNRKKVSLMDISNDEERTGSEIDESLPNDSANLIQKCE